MLHRLNKTRAAKEGVIEPSAADLIRPFVAGSDEPPRYALHFGTVDKVGVNPKSEWDTPLAVCAYPLTEEIFDQFLRIDLPFAQRGAKYLFVLEIKPDARVFYSTERFFDLGVGPEYLGADLSNVKTPRGARRPFSEMFFYSTKPRNYNRMKQFFYPRHENMSMDDFISHDVGSAVRAARWGKKLWNMGIDVWVDANREGILHPNEPSQVMFFNPSSYRVVLSMDNPKSTLQARFGRDWLKRDGVAASPVERALAGDKNLRDADLRDADLNRANLTGADLTGADLSKAELNDAKLIKAKLYGAHLTGAGLTGADLRGANLTGANLSGAHLQDVQYDDSTIWPEGVRDVLRVWRGDKDLRGADLRGANLEVADLRDAKLNGADLIGADLSGAKLIKAKLNGADLRGANLEVADLTGATLTGAELIKAKLIKAKLIKAKLIKAKLNGADLTGADLYSAILTGADLTGADLTGAYLRYAQYDDSTTWPDHIQVVLRVWRGHKNLSDADLSEANLTDADLTGVKLIKANLRGAHLSEADLTSADLSEANLRGAELIGANLTDAKLIKAKLTGAKLYGAELIKANLTSADLHYANLTGADLTGADLTGAKLRRAVLGGIIYDDSTRWPARFTPPRSAPKPNRRRRSSKSD